jgi:hypothetical protein
VRRGSRRLFEADEQTSKKVRRRSPAAAPCLIRSSERLGLVVGPGPSPNFGFSFRSHRGRYVPLIEPHAHLRTCSHAASPLPTPTCTTKTASAACALTGFFFFFFFFLISSYIAQQHC